MIKITSKSNCSGCHACANICPKQCISMVPDNEGFLYPAVNKDKCVECGLCEKVCHRLKPLTSENVPSAYACYNLDDNIRTSSSSGGMFTLFAEKILEIGGVVFGAAFDTDLEVKHFCVDSKENLYKLRGSKYVQSTIGNTYKQTKEILEGGRPVLFTGTPCQINGLLSFLGKNYENLYTQDIICHGVPSITVWKMYLKYLKKLYKHNIDAAIEPSFRSKTYGWLNFSVKVQFEKDIVYEEKHNNDLFMKSYLSNALLRPSCYKCNCKSLSRNSDITLADFWGVNKVLPEMFDDKGTSLIFVNTEKGKRLFDIIKQNCNFIETDIDVAVRHNRMAYSSVRRPLKRKKIIKNMNNWGFDKLQYECTKKSFVKKAGYKVYQILEKLNILS